MPRHLNRFPSDEYNGRVTDTLIAGIYGMSFHHIPELDWQLGYPMALGLMLIVSVLLVVFFRRRDWL